ncbi:MULTISPECIES: GNAT family N-acetyltransferase [unclassified Mesorhizobium]|uniref:GNAT family N-acetyltransferase n=1 Tax=unclassified Mesorhizobium TaxID=325217 RepID=UPI00112A9563|nr:MULTISPECIES: GNAT family N-acetyltransferase [unclassified Mesorhizobium]MBZ9810909.1 GNAT family N-acetyltransferase [Mesorhizobium sp. ESP-6-2]TPM27706.1 GNAT family N-acetyltransferase [Mesorhizobium sp. B2-2-2]
MLWMQPTPPLARRSEKKKPMPTQSKSAEAAFANSPPIRSRLSGVSLRRVGVCDRAAIKKLVLDPEQEQFAGSVDVVFDQLQNSHHPELEHPFAIVASSKTVGFFILREKQALPPWAPADAVTLHSFRICRALQGKGYGRAGVDLAISWLRRQRPYVRQLMLAVNGRNAAAKSVYLKAGFSDTGEIFHGPIGDQNILTAPIRRDLG